MSPSGHVEVSVSCDASVGDIGGTNAAVAGLGCESTAINHETGQSAQIATATRKNGGFINDIHALAQSTVAADWNQEPTAGAQSLREHRVATAR